MEYLWDADRRVLVEIVRQIEIDGDDSADTDAAIEKAGVEQPRATARWNV